MTDTANLDDIVKESRWTTTIGAVCARFGGGIQTGPFGSQLHASDYSVDGTPVVMPQDMQAGRIAPDRIVRVAQKHVDRLHRHILREGDIVFSRRGDVSRFAVVTDKEQGWLCGTGSIRIRLNSPDISVGYVRRYLQQRIVGKWLEHHAKGMTMPNLNTDVIRALPFVYPPLPEQRRIAAILDKADELRAKRTAAVEQLSGLTQTMFVEMFEAPDVSPPRWDIKPVAAYVEAFEGGKSIEAETGENTVTRNRVLKVSAVTQGKFLPTESKPVPDSYEPPTGHFVRTGDLLFSRANTTDLVGAVAYVEGSPPNLLLPDKLWRFVWRTPVLVDPLFVWALFQSAVMRRELGRRATGTSGSMKNISQAKVLSIQTMLPPLSLQQEFARRVAAVEELRARQNVAREMSDSLFTSLQHQAFSGAL